jgi:uncharacterized protein YciI
MRFAYVYFMKPEPDRVRAIAPHHAAYWQQLALRDYRGGPFADRSGGLITFDAKSLERAEELVSGDPFLRRTAARVAVDQGVDDRQRSFQAATRRVRARTKRAVVGRPGAAMRTRNGQPGALSHPRFDGDLDLTR